MKTYSKCGDDVADLVAALIKKHRPDLKKNEVTIDLLFVAHDGEGPALTLHGYACAAVVRKLGVKDRSAGRADAEIVIDHEQWCTFEPDTRKALMHHELKHLEVVMDGKARPKVDSAGRPVLKIRKHDHQIGWFMEVAQIYGRASIEVQQAEQLIAQGRQSYFAFMSGDEPKPATAKAA
jgi:hypothetical protein